MTTITLPPQAITNDAGEVALRNDPLSASQIYIGALASKNEYVATTQAAICLVWVQPRDVLEVLAKTGGCCSKRRKLFDYAGEDAVRQWTNKGGP